MSASELLKMIEAVDVGDTDALDEIDARVWLYLNHSEFLRFYFCDYKKEKCVRFIRQGKVENKPIRLLSSFKMVFAKFGKFTTSRDALKSIRPDGWGFSISNNAFRMSKDAYVSYCTAYKHNKTGGFDKSIQSEDFETEELAELSAIISAIQWERDNDK